MKAKAVSALRGERGSRPEEREAEPQVVGLAPQTTSNDRKVNTVKTYILHDPTAVETQKPRRARPPNPAPAAPATPGPEANAAATDPALFLGLDVHNDSIAVSLAPSDSTEVRRYGIIGGQHDDVLKLIQKIETAHPGLALKFCYEAGPREIGRAHV